MAKCPKCKDDIHSLELLIKGILEYTVTCSKQTYTTKNYFDYREKIFHEELRAYKCPMCHSIICKTQEEAFNFLNVE